MLKRGKCRKDWKHPWEQGQEDLAFAREKYRNYSCSIGGQPVRHSCLWRLPALPRGGPAAKRAGVPVRWSGVAGDRLIKDWNRTRHRRKESRCSLLLPACLPCFSGPKHDSIEAAHNHCAPCSPSTLLQAAREFACS